MQKLVLVFVILSSFFLCQYQQVYGQNFQNWVGRAHQMFKQTLIDMINALDQDFRNTITKVGKGCKEHIAIVHDMDTKFLKIAHSETSFAEFIHFYYEHFPSNKLTITSIRSLLESLKEIHAFCKKEPENEMDSQRSSAKCSQSSKSCLKGETAGDLQKSPRMKVGLTELSDKDKKYMDAMNGFKQSAPHKTVRFRDGSSKRCRKKAHKLPRSFDWRRKKVVTPPKNQKKCGSCWAFATASVLESYYIRKKKGHKLDLSEAQLVSCSKKNGCKGGSPLVGFNYVKNNGLTTEKRLPYRAKEIRCDGKYAPVIKIKDFCIRSRRKYTASSKVERLSDNDIRNALVVYGPLSMGINADRLSANYRNGIIDDPNCSKKVNHAVVLVGYTPEAWIIKNSWGTWWGDGGYFYLKRKKNMCGINTEMAFPL